MHKFSTTKTAISLSIAGLFSVFCGMAQADGLSDLKTSLTNLQGTAPLKAIVDVKTNGRRGKGKSLEETTGQASLSIENSARGMQVIYSKDTLTLLENEERAKEKDPKKKTPTLTAMNLVNTATLRQMASSSGQLSRTIENATFKSEKMDVFNGKPARLLSFEMSIDKLDPKERESVKKFESSLDVWIAADGTPLASQSHQHRSIRAMMVISVEMTDDVDQTYGVVGDRLVTLKKDSKNSGAGMGEKGDTKTITTLQIQS
jgi:hypothetical protein